MNTTPTIAEFLAEARKGGYLLCAGCRRTGKCRFGMSSEELLTDSRTLTKLKCAGDQEGPPAMAHGGWTAAVMDEALGHLALLHGVFAVTKTLTVEYLMPVPLERDLEIHAWVESREAGRWQIAGELRLNTAVLAKASGLFVERDAAHFLRFDRWISEQAKVSRDGQDSD